MCSSLWRFQNQMQNAVFFPPQDLPFDCISNALTTLMDIWILYPPPPSLDLYLLIWSICLSNAMSTWQYFDNIWWFDLSPPPFLLSWSICVSNALKTQVESPPRTSPSPHHPGTVPFGFIYLCKQCTKNLGGMQVESPPRTSPSPHHPGTVPFGFIYLWKQWTTNLGGIKWLCSPPRTSHPPLYPGNVPFELVYLCLSNALKIQVASNDFAWLVRLPPPHPKSYI